MAVWRSPEHLADHFRRHGRRPGLRTIEAYDSSAAETIDLGTYFEYRDLKTDAPRVGYYDRVTQRFTALTDDGATILTHYRCPERHVSGLVGSTYV